MKKKYTIKYGFAKNHHANFSYSFTQMLSSLKILYILTIFSLTYFNFSYAEESQDKTLPVTIRLLSHEEFQINQKRNPNYSSLTWYEKNLLRIEIFKNVILAHNKGYTIEDKVYTRCGYLLTRMVDGYKRGQPGLDGRTDDKVDLRSYWVKDLLPISQSMVEVLESKASEVDRANEIAKQLKESIRKPEKVYPVSNWK